MNGHQLGGKSVHVLLRVQHRLGTFEGFGWVSWKGEKYLLGPGSNACNGFRCGSELAARGRAMERMWGEEPAAGSCQTFPVCLG